MVALGYIDRPPRRFTITPPMGEIPRPTPQLGFTTPRAIPAPRQVSELPRPKAVPGFAMHGGMPKTLGRFGQPKTVTKTIKGKVYELYDYYPSSKAAKIVADNLEGRLHIFTGKITKTQVTKVSDKKYAVWHRKED